MEKYGSQALFIGKMRYWMRNNTNNDINLSQTPFLNAK